MVEYAFVVPPINQAAAPYFTFFCQQPLPPCHINLGFLKKAIHATCSILSGSECASVFNAVLNCTHRAIKHRADKDILLLSTSSRRVDESMVVVFMALHAITHMTKSNKNKNG